MSFLFKTYTFYSGNSWKEKHAFEHSSLEASADLFLGLGFSSSSLHVPQEVALADFSQI